MPKELKTTGKRDIGTPRTRFVRALPLSPVANVPTTPVSRDSRSRQYRLLSSPSTTTTAPTTRSRSKPYNLRSRPTKPLIKRTIPKRRRRLKLMGKGSDWTTSQELAFLNILKDQILTGNIKDCAPNACMWPGLTTRLNEITGMSKTSQQVEEKLRRMKKRWRQFYQLLHHETGFGYDPDKNTVSGTTAQWDAYLAVHKNAKPFRRKGLANYELMCELFSGSCATGVLHHASTASPGDTDDERDFDDQLNGLGIDDSHGSGMQSPSSAAQPPSATPINSGKRTNDNSSSVHLRPKRSKGNSRSDTSGTALLKFVGAQERRNDILENWITLQSKAAGIACSSQDGADASVDPYSKCLLCMQALLGENEHAVFLKGCKELQNEFMQKAFMIMTDAQRKSWLYSL